MQRKTLYLTIVAALLAAPSTQASSLTEAITGGKANADLRLRYEAVNLDSTTTKDARAFTLRSRLGYTTGDFMSTSATLEFEDVTVLKDSYAPETAGYATVADPGTTEVNQAHLSFKGIDNTTVKFGRQRIIYDNARFIGNVGWRQNEQTFDAATLSSKLGEAAVLNYGYLWHQRDISSVTTDISSHLLNLSLKNVGPGTLTAYGYLIGYDVAKANSQKTVGARYAGKLDAAALKYTLEYAKQSAYQDGNSGIDANYLLAELGATVSGIELLAGYEKLGADDYSGFETPFATKHAFNGWADMFLNTPKNGLKDRYLSIGTKVADAKLQAVYHQYKEDKGGLDLGSELNLLASKPYGKHYAVTAKYANYRTGDGTQKDTSKLWLMGEMKF